MSSIDAGTPPFDPQDPAFVDDPYPTYAELRANDPVHRTPHGYWVLTRYDDVIQALADERLGNAPSRRAAVHERHAERHFSASVAANILPFLDPPRHAAPRRRIGKVYAQHLRSDPLDMDAAARELLAPHLERGEVDVVHDFGRPLSVVLISRLMGVPQKDEARLTEWSEQFFRLFTVIPSEEVLARMDVALAEFRTYFIELIATRRAAPADDLVSRFAGLEGELTDDELADNCMLLWSDGVENLDAAIGNAIIALLEHPAELERLRAEPALLPSAVEELLRYDSPAQFIGRVAREDLELGGQLVKSQHPVLLVLASANRDSAKFDRADELVLDRTPNPHLTFGKGRHACLGGGFVAAEMRAALGALLEATSEFRLIGPVRRRPRMGHRWLEELPLGLSRR